MSAPNPISDDEIRAFIREASGEPLTPEEIEQSLAEIKQDIADLEEDDARHRLRGWRPSK